MQFRGKLKGDPPRIILGHVSRIDVIPGLAYVRVSQEWIPYICLRSTVGAMRWDTLKLGQPIRFHANSFRAITEILE